MSDIEKVIADERAAYELFGSRWEVSALQATDPVLFSRLADQERLYCEAQDEEDVEAIVLHGEAMIRGWQAATKRMEDNEIAQALRVFPGAKVIAIRAKFEENSG